MCQAMYTEDELMYNARIISIDQSASTCVVRYEGYENEEEQYLDDLLPPYQDSNSIQHRSASSQSEVSLKIHYEIQLHIIYIIDFFTFLFFRFLCQYLNRFLCKYLNTT